MIRFFVFITLLLSICACTKEAKEPAFEPIPHIELLEVSNDTIIEFMESIILTLSYQDGDGDLGNPDANINSIYVKDNRLDNPDEFYLQPLAPVGESISITGQLNVSLSNTFLLGNADIEQTIFSIYVIDRAGNQSNVVQTPTITIFRP